jgi:hypothetical protein
MADFLRLKRTLKQRMLFCIFGWLCSELCSKRTINATTLKSGEDNKKDGKKINVGTGSIPALKPYEKTNVFFSSKPVFEKGKEYTFMLSILLKDKQISTYEFKATPLK